MKGKSRLALILLLGALLAPAGSQSAVDLSLLDLEIIYGSRGTLIAEVIIVFDAYQETEEVDTDLTVFLDGDSTQAEPLIIEPTDAQYCSAMN